MNQSPLVSNVSSAVMPPAPAPRINASFGRERASDTAPMSMVTTKKGIASIGNLPIAASAVAFQDPATIATDAKVMAIDATRSAAATRRRSANAMTTAAVAVASATQGSGDGAGTHSVMPSTSTRRSPIPSGTVHSATVWRWSGRAVTRGGSPPIQCARWSCQR